MEKEMGKEKEGGRLEVKLQSRFGIARGAGPRSLDIV